jgi:hypothetical protein
MLVTIDTSLIPSPMFSPIVRKNITSRPVRRCPVADPSWLTTLLNTGLNMQLADVLVQAGRHFADSLNPDAFAPGATNRQRATAMAWTIISLISPTVASGELVVEDPIDGDIKRLCSEILGVGMSLEVLRKQKVIDGRTIRKISAGFDFDAIERGGGGRVLIEAKRTFRDASTSEHRTSIYNKIINEGLPRGYSRAIGVIASLWTATDARDFDLEICDPEDAADNHFELAVREIIRFYARRFEEAVAMPKGVELLFHAATSPDLFDKSKPSPLPLPEATLQHQRLLDPLRHNSLRLNRAGVVQEFWGRIWEARKLPIPLPFDRRNEAIPLQAFIGIDSAIFRFIHDRDFRSLLDYETSDEGLWEARGQTFRAVFHVDSYGVVTGVYEGSLPINVNADEKADRGR